MNQSTIGGHLITQYDFSTGSKHQLATDPYFYYHQILSPGEELKFSQARMVTIYILKSNPSASIKMQGAPLNSRLLMWSVLTIRNA